MDPSNFVVSVPPATFVPVTVYTSRRMHHGSSILSRSINRRQYHPVLPVQFLRAMSRYQRGLPSSQYLHLLLACSASHDIHRYDLLTCYTFSGRGHCRYSYGYIQVMKCSDVMTSLFF